MDFCALVNVECGTPWSVRDRNASSDYDGGRAHTVSLESTLNSDPL
jgi:hypothetical protein